MNAWPCRAGTGATRRRGLTATGTTVLLTLTLAAVAGCGGTSANPPASGAGSAAAASPTGKPAAGTAGGPSGTLTLTGYYTYDGPFTGMFVCHYDNSGYFALEGQEPYLMNITVQKMREGTFVVHEQDPATGFQKSDPGQPVIDVRRLDKQDGGSDAVVLRQAGGTITFAEGGSSGTLSADYIDVLNNKEKVHAELHWTNCVH